MYIQDYSKQGAKAAEWSKKVSDVVGGKAGGKHPIVVGHGTEPKHIDQAIEEATKYLEQFTM